jgi:hypothetical protein
LQTDIAVSSSATRLGKTSKVLENRKSFLVQMSEGSLS